MVELDPDREAWNKLKLLCSISSKLWNEVNYARRRQFFETKRVDLRNTYKEFYERYKMLIGSATAQQILNKNDEAWRSFFGLLKARKEGRLPPFMRRVSPPGYKKRGGFRTLWTVLRKDQYRIEGDRIVIKGLGAIGVIVVEYRGLIHVRGEQGRLEIRYDPDRGRWYAHISFSEVREKLVRGSWVEVPRKPRGSLEAGVDIGVNNLMAVYVEDGRAFLVNGRPLKAISHYWMRKIARYQSTLNKYELRTSRRLRLMYRRWRLQIKNYIDSRVRSVMEKLYEMGVSRLKVGYPRYITQESGDFNNVHVWTYGYLLRRLVEVGEEYAIEVVLSDEKYSSSKCPLHRSVECGVRIKRGLFKCVKTNKVFNADLVGAYNILVDAEPITPSPERGRGNGPETRPRAKPSQRGCSPNLPALTGGTLAL